MRQMGTLLACAAYAFYAAFIGRLFLHVLLWIRASGQAFASPAYAVRVRPGTAAVAVLDLLMFRRLFSQNKLLWIGSWTFHLSFLLVVLSHLRYFLNPVPACVTRLQPFGLAAGYLLPLSLILLLCLRAAAGKSRYVSVYNYFLLSAGLVISLSGLSLRIFFRPDLAEIKAFILGMLTFMPDSLPQSLVFVAHFGLVLLLLPFLPLHMIAAPLVTLDARRREDELRMVMHEK